MTIGRGHPVRAEQNAAGTTEAERSRDLAKKKYEEGVEAYRNERYVDAVRLFLDADTLSPSVALSYDIARAYEKLGDEASTLRWYRNYLRLAPEAPNRAAVLQSIQELGKALAGKGIQQLTVLSVPAGATVAIDGQAVGVTPLTTELRPGDHSALLTARGYADVQRSFNLMALTPMDVTFDLEPVRAEAPTRTAAAAGTEGKEGHGRRFGIVPLVTIGAGVLALGSSLAFEISRRSAQNDARNEQEQLSFQRDVEAMNTRQTASRVLLGVGGVLVITGATLWIFNTPASPQSRVAISSLPGGATLSISRNF
jgi:hypothetical protein